MTVDVRSLGDGLPSTFDFNSQEGILFLLRAIRNADVTSADKNKLKDLVFLYNTGGKDQAVKQKLEETLLSLAVTPASAVSALPKDVITTGTEAPVLPLVGFALGRPAPVFMVSPVDVTTPTIQKVEVESAPPDDIPKPIVAEVTPIPAAEVQVEKKSPVSRVPVMPIAPIHRPQAEQNAEPLASNDIELAQKSVSSVAPSTPIPTSIPTREVSPVPAEPTPDVTIARLERIRVIKSDVNARVGNPVNLVDVDNTLGREYMSALLEAMKLLSSASVAESDNAMARLETVYSHVLELLATKDKAEVIVEAVPAPAPEVVPEPVVLPEMIPVVRVPVPEPIMRVAPVVAVASVPVTDFAIRSKVTDRPEVPPAMNAWEAPQILPKLVDVVPSVAQTVAPQDTVVVSRLTTPPAEQLRPVVEPVAPLYHPEITPAVSSVTPLRAITELPTADEVSAVEAMGSNPLYTKDIDAGLEQLLGEWSIFKKSGLFGTGPKGREHPLYIKISPLQVPLILSGRFEGSTQEIKQSITDYMNGWRYEQGIIYEANETLDQYLRRVIRHIIDLQKTKRRS
jgi:hypothetical protein